MKKRKLVLALALAFTIALCPVAAAEEPVKLATPTSLEWGMKYRWDGTKQPIPGYFSWRTEGEFQGVHHIAIYKVGISEPIFQGDSEVQAYAPNCFSDDISTNFVQNGLELDSGTYYFTIQNISQQSLNYADSNIATSPTWTYTKPSAKLSTPPSPVWGNFPEFTWDVAESGSKVLSGIVQLYYSKTQNGVYEKIGATWWLPPGKGRFYEGYLDWYGAGYYKVRVLNLSADITKWQSSNWSDLSEPYGYGETEQLAEGTLSGSQDLAWSYTSDGLLSITQGEIPQGHIVFVACYDGDGYFTGVRTLTAQEASALLNDGTVSFKIIWTDGILAPQSPSATVSIH